MKTITKKLVSVVSDECVSNFAELMDELECQKEYSPIDESATEYIPYTLGQFTEKTSNKIWFECHDSTGRVVNISNYPNHIYYGYQTSDYKYWSYTKVNSVEELFHLSKPHWKKTYLKNGKVYRRDIDV